jgi:hypothetical protein
MSGEDTAEAIQVLGLSVFYDHQDDERKTFFDSEHLRDTVRGIIEGSGHSPDAMIGTVASNAHSKT